jgi:hypothetical protein
MAEQSSGGHTHANRDETDIKGSPRRDAEQTGEKGSGRSAVNEPAPRRNTRDKEREA